MIAFFVALAFMPAILPLSGWIVKKTFNAAERFGRFRGTICL